MWAECNWQLKECIFILKHLRFVKTNIYNDDEIKCILKRIFLGERLLDLVPFLHAYLWESIYSLKFCYVSIYELFISSSSSSLHDGNIRNSFLDSDLPSMSDYMSPIQRWVFFSNAHCSCSLDTICSSVSVPSFRNVWLQFHLCWCWWYHVVLAHNSFTVFGKFIFHFRRNQADHFQ